MYRAIASGAAYAGRISAKASPGRNVTERTPAGAVPANAAPGGASVAAGARATLTGAASDIAACHIRLIGETAGAASAAEAVPALAAGASNHDVAADCDDRDRSIDRFERHGNVLGETAGTTSAALTGAAGAARASEGVAAVAIATDRIATGAVAADARATERITADSCPTTAVSAGVGVMHGGHGAIAAGAARAYGQPTLPGTAGGVAARVAAGAIATRAVPAIPSVSTNTRAASAISASNITAEDIARVRFSTRATRPADAIATGATIPTEDNVARLD
jgi:hypothetical protein